MSCGWLPFSSAPLMDARGHKHIAGCQYAAIYLQYQMSRLESFGKRSRLLSLALMKVCLANNGFGVTSRRAMLKENAMTLKRGISESILNPF